MVGIHNRRRKGVSPARKKRGGTYTMGKRFLPGGCFPRFAPVGSKGSKPPPKPPPSEKKEGYIKWVRRVKERKERE